MDDQRFDQLARTLGRATGRRHVLRGLGVFALSGLFARRATAQAVATCSQPSDCIDPEGDPCIGATCEDGTCAVYIVDCAPGFTCCNNGECCESTPTCSSDADCPSSDDPCTTTTCVDGACVARIVDRAIGYTCCAGGCVPGCPAGHSLDPSCRCTPPGGDFTGGTPDVTDDTDGMTVTSADGSVSASTSSGGVSATSDGRTVTVGTMDDSE